MIYKEYKTDTYNIYTVKTNKFKTCHMEIIFRNNIDIENITKRSLLSLMLVENTKLYKTKKELMIKLEELYNAYFYSVNNRIGKSILTSFCFDFINPDLVNENIEEFIKFPIESIMNPNININEFDTNTFKYIKNRLKNDIESIIEDPKKLSIQRLLQNMYPNKVSSIDINGNIDDLELINESNLYEYYLSMLDHDYIDIYIIGDLDMDKVSNIIKDNLKINIFKNHKIDYIIDNESRKKEKIIYEYNNFNQENICFGLNIDNINDYERNYVGYIYNMLLGGSSLDTKLYNNLRNDNSLCYNCSSIYQKFDNLIIIHTAISENNESSAIKLIKKSINDMKNINEEELNNVKKLAETTLKMSLDNPSRIIDNYIFKNLYGLEPIETRINKYNKVSIEDIINFHKKIKINTILCMKEDNNGKN